MFRFISFMLGRDWEPCRSCENLKQQLEFERSEKRLLIDTLVSIVSPKAVESPPLEINQIAQSSSLFSRRRAALEERDRQEARILAEKKFVGVPDNLRQVNPPNPFTTEQTILSQTKTVQELEEELGVKES
jgi:hypothetical protein